MGRFAVLALLGLASLATGQGDVVRTGKTFAVTLHPDKLAEELAVRLADGALAAAEAMRPVLDKLGVPPPKAAMLHVHVGAATFRVAETKSSPAAFQVTEFAAADGLEAHVRMAPQLSAPVLKEVGLPAGTARRLQWCAAWVAARQASDNVKQDPWLGDVVAFGAVDALADPKGVGGLEPWYDERRLRYAHWHAEGHAIKLAPILADTRPISSLERHVDRTLEATVVAQLFASAGGSWARKVLAEPAKPLATVPLRKSIATALLGKDEAKHEHRFGTMVAGLRPLWAWSGGNVGARNGRVLLVGNGKEQAWVEAVKPPAPEFVLRGSARILTGSNDHVGFALAADADWKTYVTVTTDRVIVETWTKEAGRFQQVAEVKRETPLRQPFAVRLEVGADVQVHLDGNLVLTHTMSGKTITAWGVNVYDAAVEIEGFACEPLAAGKGK